MKYKIERAIANCPSDGWVPSDTFSLEYTDDEARHIVQEETFLRYRTVPVQSKPYRRHAAVTPLELRGAISMLRAAQKHIVVLCCNGVPGEPQYTAWGILQEAKLACARHLDTL
jgi:hypothetical protein